MESKFTRLNFSPALRFHRGSRKEMRTNRHGFTLIELLVAISIVGIMVALLLPAVQSAREAGRRATCQNNLKQICISIDLHVASTRHYPFGGWGHEWVGVPGRGSGARQPGSWVYSVLPYLEHGDLHDLGINHTGAAEDEDYSRRLSTPLPVFTCPTRRTCATWEVASSYAYAGMPRPAGHVPRVARSDYAINGGASHVLSFRGPESLEVGDDRLYWKDKTYVGTFTGVSHLRTAASLNTFDDGFGKTYLVGEKMIDPSMYDNGLSVGDNDSIYSGFSNDLHRYTGLLGSSSPWLPPIPDGNENIEPRGYVRFGSAHGDGFHMAYCDGAVKFIDFGVDPEVHFRAGHRRDEGIAIELLR